MSALPVSLHRKLTALGRRIRRLRLLRGTSVLFAALLLAGSTALAADHFFTLSAIVRGGLLAAWLGFGSLVAFFALVRPLRRPVPLDALAALIEEHYPDLGERLTTSVELAVQPDAYHGAHCLIELLQQETAVQTERLDFARGPGPAPYYSPGAAGLLMLLVLISATAAPVRALELGQRFLAPWYEPTTDSADAALPVPPVALTADTTLTVTPPEYAHGVHDPATLSRLANVSALEHSQLAFQLRFDRPATEAVLEWTTPAGDMPERLPLTLTDDRLGAQRQQCVPLSGSYRYKILLTGAGGRTELGPYTVTVQPDQPPRITRVTGAEDGKAVLAYDRIPLDMTLTDDIGISRADIEVEINRAAVPAVPVELKSGDTRWVTARAIFRLSKLRRPDGKELQAGDVVRYRLRAADNRRVDGLEPHEVVLPADRWWTLTISANAEPLEQPVVSDQHERLKRRLESVRKDVDSEHRSLDHLRTEAEKQPALTADQLLALTRLSKEVQASRDALAEAAREAAPVEALKPLAGQIQNVADTELTRSGQELSQALNEGRPEMRGQQLTAANQDLSAALDKLEQLLQTNEQTARARQDRLKVELLHERQEQLLDRTAELADKDPVERAALRRAQADLARELQQLTGRSEALQQAVAADQGRRLDQLADQMHNLAREQKELADKEHAAEAQHAKQQEIEQKTGKVGEQLQQLGQEMSRSPSAEETGKALAAEQKGQEMMRQADEQERQGKPAEAQQLRREAAAMLEKAAAEMNVAARKTPSSESARQAGAELRQGQEGMQRAQAELEQERPTEAKAGMKQAADALQQLARQMGPPDRRSGQDATTTRQSPTGAVPNGLPSLGALDAELKPFAGKRWGELPGELQTRIMNELTARYGPDGARIIRQYFEQIAQ